MNNGGCHDNADCVVNDSHEVNCTCKSKYEGDGVDCSPSKLKITFHIKFSLFHNGL